jgi:hypothetical protein
MKRLVLTFFIAAALLLTHNCSAYSIEELCREHPERINILFDNLDMEYDGLEDVKAAFDAGSKAAACRELIEYYRSDGSGGWLRNCDATPTENINNEADDILNDTFVFQGVKGTVPREKSGGLDWDYSPNDDFQWTLFLNRHFHLRTLMDAYNESGNSAYVKKISDDLRDWIITRPYTGKGLRHVPTNKQWQWSLLEVGSRGEIWPKVFYALYDQLDDDVKILMLSSVPDHLSCMRNFHSRGGNHLALEMKGLATMAGSFREFKVSDPYLDYAQKLMTESLFAQVYPDGVQKELTVHYHGVAFRAFYAFSEVYENIGRALPNEFTDLVYRMLDYMAYVARPNGCGPLNNDSDYVYSWKNIERVVDKYDRDDWRYIISNGNEGKEPDKLSVYYPWAGQAVMRSGWDKDARWSFFDMGPWGIGHQHSDKLHLSITAYGRDIIVDSGRYTYVGYKGGPDYPWRDYFITSPSHNVILVDGKGQKPRTAVFKEPLNDVFVSTDKYDFARGIYDEGYDGIDDDITHTRALLYLREGCWVVADRFEAGKPHKVEAMWRYHPDCEVVREGLCVASADDGKGNIRITPVLPEGWELELVRGRPEPSIQGWYSREYNMKTPNTVAVYSAQIDEPCSFVWVFTADQSGKPKPVEAKIISENESRVVLSVKTDGDKSMILNIPMDSDVNEVSVRKE